VNFSQNDIQQINNKGLTVTKVKSQIELFKKGVPFVNLKNAATVNHGILRIDAQDKKNFIDFFDQKRPDISILKFVPASGAATRMFKFLFQFLEDYNPEKESINSYINQNKAAEMSLFLVGIEKFPFYDTVLKKTKEHVSDFETLSDNKQKLALVKTMLDDNKLNYGHFPKGLLPFHQYKDHVSTAFEEHLFEAALYASTNHIADLHFTISEIHNHKFDQEFKRIQNIVEKKTNTKFNISFSYQKQATDTIAVTPENKPFREADGSLVFRPSGHGALLENLNDLDADLVFIKNIDNVVVFKFEEQVAQYKKMLAGILLQIQEQAFQYLEQLEQDDISENEVITIAEFLSNKMNVVISLEFEKYSKKIPD